MSKVSVSLLSSVCCWWLYGGGWDGKMYVVAVSSLLSIQPVLIATVVVCLRSDPSRKSRTRQKKATRKLAHSLRFANTKKDYRFFLWFFWKINFFDVFNFIIFLFLIHWNMLSFNTQHLVLHKFHLDFHLLIVVSIFQCYINWCVRINSSSHVMQIELCERKNWRFFLFSFFLLRTF